MSIFKVLCKMLLATLTFIKECLMLLYLQCKTEERSNYTLIYNYMECRILKSLVNLPFATRSTVEVFHGYTLYQSIIAYFINFSD